MFDLIALAAVAPVVIAAQQDAVDASTIEQRIEAYQSEFQSRAQAGTLNWETVQELAKQVFDGVDFSTLTMEQLLKLHELNILEYGGRTADAYARLKDFQDPDTLMGAKAAMLRAMFAGGAPDDPRNAVAALTEALEHKYLNEALAEPIGQNFLFALPNNPEPVLKGSDQQLLAFADAIDDTIAPETAVGFSGLWEALQTSKTSDDQDAERERIRQKLVTIGNSKVSQLTDEGMAKWFRSSLKFLDGAAARGMLIGHAAPELNFLWSSDPAVKSMDDLRGKVVVLDFWATWCGPCIASFPDVHKLVEHYQGYPVVVVGVTSPQGSFIPAEGQPVECEGNPEKEFELTPEFMKARDMNWTVVYTQEDVFNPDFGIRGIPHVAIIDTKGIVRYNGLHPSSQVTPTAEKHAKINELLTQAGLPAPTEDDAAEAPATDDHSGHDHE